MIQCDHESQDNLDLNNRVLESISALKTEIVSSREDMLLEEIRSLQIQNSELVSLLDEASNLAAVNKISHSAQNRNQPKIFCAHNVFLPV
jgi:hypothetical protein